MKPSGILELIEYIHRPKRIHPIKNTIPANLSFMKNPIPVNKQAMLVYTQFIFELGKNAIIKAKEHPIIINQFSVLSSNFIVNA